MEGEASSTIAKFRFGNAGLGNRFPWPGHVMKQTSCPLCPSMTKNSELHLTFFCIAVGNLRRQKTSIPSFQLMCQAEGMNDEEMFSLFVNGQDSKGSFVETKVFLARGHDMMVLLEAWLDLW